jgi:molecular chaperone HscB
MTSVAEDYFTVLGLAPRFDLDTGVIKQHYLDKQKVMHPDNFATADLAIKNNVSQQSARVNAAFRTLNDPLQRAIYLLELNHAPQNAALSPDFLMQQMELQEQIAESEHDNLAVINNEITATIAALSQNFAQCLTQAQIDWEQAAEIVSQWQFYAKAQEKVELMLWQS